MLERSTNILIAILSIIVGIGLIAISFYIRDDLKIGYYIASVGFSFFGIVTLLFYLIKKK